MRLTTLRWSNREVWDNGVSIAAGSANIGQLVQLLLDAGAQRVLIERQTDDWTRSLSGSAGVVEGDRT